MDRDFLKYLGAASEELRSRKDEINKLNVFPVPDGDTGTNMSLTLDMVMKELGELPPDASLAAYRKAITHGSLMGARGNSGVITSQILRGICEGLEDATAFDSATIAKALARGVEVAFQAVRKPVEGTILTVVRDASDAAGQAAEDGMSRDEALRFISEAAFASVKRTPDLLPVLKENGVVDAGGFGLSILIDGFVGAVTGDTTFIPDSSTFSHAEPKVAIEQINDWAGSDYLYCTEFLLHGDKIDKQEVSEFLQTMGDCDLIVGEIPNFKVHVHTNTPGTVLSYMTEHGQVSEVHIHNMKLQAEDRVDSIEKDHNEPDAMPTPPNPPKEIGFVAVASGSGMADILRSLGVDYVVTGGQTMNPSTKDLLEAVDAVNAKSVIILPDNGNIIMAAQAASSASDKPVGIVPTKAVPEAFTAMFTYDPDASLEDNVAAMTEALANVKCGEVTHAVKRSKADDGTPIRKGDVIGLTHDAILAVGKDIADVTVELVGDLIDEDSDTLTLLAGIDLGDEALQGISSRIEEKYPDIEVDALRGEQPLYPVVLSIE